MFGLFGRKTQRSVEDDLIPTLKRQVVGIQESTGASYLAIAEPLLTFGVALLVKDKGPTGLAQAINTLGTFIENELQASTDVLGSSIIDVKIPEQPPATVITVINSLEDFVTHFINKGYSFEELGGAMINVSGQVAKHIDKDGLLGIGLFRKELEARHAEYLQLGRGMERPEEQSTVEKLIQQGQKHLQAQNIEGAISAFSAALRIKPDNGSIYFHRGVAWSNSYYNEGKRPDDLRKAIADYTRSIEIDPEFAEGYFQRAGLLSDQGQVAKAIADYSKAIEKNHKASSSYFCRALLWQRTGDGGKMKAIADLDGAIRTGDKSDQFSALFVRGEMHYGLGNLELALADFNAAAAYYSTKTPPGVYEKRAAVWLALGRTREAISDFGDAIAAASSLADPRFIANMYDQRGQCLMRLGESQLARQDFERAAQLTRRS